MGSAGSFCDCEVDTDDDIMCHCGEDFDASDWNWEEPPCSNQVKVELSHNQREVLFNPVVSVGTSAVRGTIPFLPGRQYLWEIKMLSTIYGTDVVVGIGTTQVDLTAHSQKFIALVGNDSESWGFSYRGDILHAGNRSSYGPSFGKGSIVGVHLNMWTGTVEFYLNRQRLGVAFQVSRSQALYPMICSTMKNCAMRLVSTLSWPVSLELSCLQSISSMPQLSDIPGLKAVWGKTFWWHQATAEKTHAVKQQTSEVMDCELEIISSDDEEQEKMLCQFRKVLPCRQRRRQIVQC